MSLKVRLLVGAAAPLALILPAAAQVSISTATTTPVSTATANNGAASDVIITSAGSITLTGQTAPSGVTINSNNTLTNNGQIAIPNTDNATGVRIQPGLTTGYSGTGTINLLEDYTRPDSDNDGDLDGPLAQGTGRVGLLVEPGAAVTGNINFLSGSGINVEGNNSAAVSVRSALNGGFRSRGALSLTGANGFAIEFRDDVTGNIQIGGSVTAVGEGSTAVSVLGDVGGEFVVDGAVLATGYTSTQISNYADPDDILPNEPSIAARRDADDLLIGGPAIAIRGDLARGFLVNGVAIGVTDPTADVKDVIQNYNENRATGSVSSFGSAPAILVQSQNGAAGGEVRLGRVQEGVRDTLDDDDDDNVDEILRTFDYDFGFINRGTIIGSGFNVGVASTAVRFAGSADGQHQTIVEGGIYNSGQITGAAFEADTIALHIGAGASTPMIHNFGNIASTINTETTHSSQAVRIDAGASVGSFLNAGSITSNTRGWDGNSIAVRDLSGTLTSFRNQSRIAAGFTDDDATDNITSGAGRAIALDLSHSLSGVTLTQTDPIDNARIFGEILLGQGNDRIDLLSGEVVGKVDFGTGTDTLNINSARLAGDTTFRGTSANVSLASNSIMVGGLSLGNAGGALNFAGGSLYDGAITRTSNTAALSMAVNNATVNNRATGTLQLSSMQLANSSNVGFVINNARIASGAPIFNISGAADIAANTLFTPIFEQFTDQQFTLRVLTAGSLNLGGPVAQMLNTNSPFLYNVTLQRPAGTNAIDLVLRVKSANELGLTTGQSAAYTSVLDLLTQDDDVAAAISSITNGPEFRRAFSDIMPGPDEGLTQLLATNATAAFGATAHRLDLVSRKPDAPGGAWVEEFGVYHEHDASSDTLGLYGGGFGVAAGLDLIASRNWVLGAYLSLESLELEERGRTAAPINLAQTSYGVYGGLKFNQVSINGAASIGQADFTSDREIRVGALTDRIRGDWNGQTTSAAARATWTLPVFNFLDVIPYAAIDYTKVTQDAYRETATTNEGLELIFSDNESALSTASYGVSLVGQFGDSGGNFVTRPELSVGYRSILQYDSPSGTARFGNSTANANFRLPGIEPEDAVVAGLGININGQFVNMKFGYDAEIAESSITHYGSVTLRLAFW